jgi:hypothetical protein
MNREEPSYRNEEQRLQAIINSESVIVNHQEPEITTESLAR